MKISCCRNPGVRGQTRHRPGARAPPPVSGQGGDSARTSRRVEALVSLRVRIARIKVFLKTPFKKLSHRLSGVLLRVETQGPGPSWKRKPKFQQPSEWLDQVSTPVGGVHLSWYFRDLGDSERPIWLKRLSQRGRYAEKRVSNIQGSAWLPFPGCKNISGNARQKC